jgi:hypothetical protein
LKNGREKVREKNRVFFEKTGVRRNGDSANPRKPETFDMGIVGKCKKEREIAGKTRAGRGPAFARFLTDRRKEEEIGLGGKRQRPRNALPRRSMNRIARQAGNPSYSARRIDVGKLTVGQAIVFQS